MSPDFDGGGWFQSDFHMGSFDIFIFIMARPSRSGDGVEQSKPSTGREPGDQEGRPCALRCAYGAAPVTRLRVIVCGNHVFLSAGWRRAARIRLEQALFNCSVRMPVSPGQMTLYDATLDRERTNAWEWCPQARACGSEWPGCRFAYPTYWVLTQKTASSRARLGIAEAARCAHCSRAVGHGVGLHSNNFTGARSGRCG